MLSLPSEKGDLMIDFELQDDEYVTLSEAKAILAKLKSKEMTEEQKLAVDHIKRAKILSEDKAKKMREELIGLNMRKLKEKYIIQIVDLMPTSAEELKIILASSKINFKKKDLDNIMKVVEKHAK
jgi:DNA-directed RNA polymerase subunit F